MSESLRTILAVAVLTMAIWVWADLEQTGESEEQVPVKVTVPPDYILRTITPEHVTVKFKGPRGAIQDLKASPDDVVCRFDLSEQELKASPLVLHARDGFRAWPARRIVVTDVKGDRDGETDVVVWFDRLIAVKVRVEPKVAGAVPIVATAQPAEVTARVAESQWKALPEAKRFAVATLDASSIIPQSAPVVREVPLERKLGGDSGVEAAFDPPIVTITARVESRLETKSMGRLPILVSAPPDLFNRYRIIFQPGVEPYVDLKVQGPKADIDRLGPQDIRVQLILTADDKPDPASWLPGKPVVVGLPPTVKLVDPLPTVNFNLEKQNEKPPTP